MKRAWIRTATVVMAVGLLGGCDPGTSIGDLQETLVETYIQPLEDAGLTTAVTRTCRFEEGGVDAPWHLRVDIDVAGPEDRVADILEAQDVVLRRDREPMIVQQILNQPNVGWDGILSGSGERAKLSLERNRATHADRADALAWAEICAPDA